MNEAVNRALRGPETRAQLERQAYEPVGGGTPGEFSDYVKAETAKWGTIVRESSIQGGVTSPEPR